MARAPAVEPAKDALQGRLLEAIGEAVMATTPDGTIIYWNKAAEDLYGWSREEALGENIMVVTPAPAMIEEAETIMALLTQGETWTGEFEVQRKDGSTFPALVTDSPVLDDDENLVAIIGVSRDLTETHRLTAYLKEAQEIAGLGIWEYEPASQTFWASKHKRKMLGLPTDEPATLEDVMTLIKPDDRERLEASLQDLMENPRDHRMQYTLQRPDGEERIIDTRIRVQTDPKRGLIIYGTSQDITSQVRTEETLREKAKQLSNAERVGNAGSWIWDIENDEATWSMGQYALLGIDPDDVQGLTYDVFLDHVHHDDRDRLKEVIQQALEKPGESPFTYDFRIVRPDGEIRWLQARAHVETNDAGQPNRVYGHDVDITETKRLENDLLKKQDLLDDVEKIAQAGYWGYDVETGVGEWSDGFYRLLGYTPGNPPEPTSQDYISRVHPEDLDEIEEDFQQALSNPSDEPVTDKHRILLPDGTTRWLEARYQVETENGEPHRIVGKSIDITEHRMLELELASKIRALERRNLQLGRITMASAHPLREAVRETSINLQRITKSAEDRMTPTEMESLDAANNAAKHFEFLLDAINQYLTLAEHLPSHEPVDLDAMLDRVLTELNEPIENTQATITRGTLPTIQTGDKNLHKVLHVLVNNALMYARDAPPKVHVDAKLDEDVWLISVEDEGIGIDPDYHERIFHPFIRLQTTKGAPGASIGLPMCRWIIEDLGGNIWLTSTPGEGSTFYFTLPVKPRDPLQGFGWISD